MCLLHQEMLLLEKKGVFSYHKILCVCKIAWVSRTLEAICRKIAAAPKSLMVMLASTCTYSILGMDRNAHPTPIKFARFSVWCLCYEHTRNKSIFFIPFEFYS